MQDVRDIDVTTLIPQRRPFVAVGRLSACEPMLAVSETRVADMPLFVENGKLTPAGLIENMAQTCAAKLGYFNLTSGKTEPQNGFIGAIRDCFFNRLPGLDETIVTTIEVEEEFFGLTLVSAQVRASDELVARAALKIALDK